MPQFSVIVPLYNKEKHIKRTLDSILQQSCQDFEILVVNDGSTDNSTDEVAKITDPRIQLIHQDNQGESVARNTGINAANGKIISFLDADDEWEYSYLEKIKQLTTRFPDAGLYCTNYEIIEPGNRYEARIKGLPHGFTEGILPSFFQSIALGNSPVFIGATSIPREIFNETGLFTAGVRLYADLEFWTRIALRHKIVFTTELQSYYHKDATNRICMNILPDAEDLPFRRHIEDAINNKVLSGPDIVFANRFINKYRLMNAFKCLVGGRKEVARQMAYKSTPCIYLLARKYFILISSYLPSNAINCIWRAGQFQKRLISKFSHS